MTHMYRLFFGFVDSRFLEHIVAKMYTTQGFYSRTRFPLLIAYIVPRMGHPWAMSKRCKNIPIDLSIVIVNTVELL